MKPFTEQEMIRVARAAGYDVTKYRFTSESEWSMIEVDRAYCLQIYILNGKVLFELYDRVYSYSLRYDILAVADTIREIIKEREG